jgi:hypothetical protein
MKRCVVFAVMACLGFTTTSRAMPPDSPDIVYIDGRPCNRLCQSYMAWSRKVLNRSAHDSYDVPSQVAAPAVAKPKPALHDHLVTPRVAGAEPNHTAIAKLPARTANGSAATNAKPADTSSARPAETPDMKQAETPDTRKPETPETARTSALDGALTTRSAPNQAEASAAEMAEARQSDDLSLRPEPDSSIESLPRSIRAQVVAAAAVAERSTPPVIESPQQRQMGDSARQRASADPRATEPDADRLVALLISRPEIKSVAELAGKVVAIDNRQSASETSVRIALVAAGATEVQLRDGDTKAIDRLLGGEVPAAVVTVVSPEAAAAFPDIAGFTVFKIPLAPR